MPSRASQYPDVVQESERNYSETSTLVSSVYKNTVKYRGCELSKASVEPLAVSTKQGAETELQTNFCSCHRKLLLVLLHAKLLQQRSPRQPETESGNSNS